MSKWSPYDLPHLIESYRLSLSAALDQANAESPEDKATLVTRLTDTIATVVSPSMMWLDASVCKLVEDAHDTVPDWVPKDVLPVDTGLIAFENPFIRLPDSVKIAPEDFVIEAIRWHRRSDGVVDIYPMSRAESGAPWDFGEIPEAAIKDVMQFDILDNRLLGAGKNAILDETNSEMEGYGEEFAREVVSVTNEFSNSILSALGAALLLISQPNMVEDGGTTESYVRNRPRLANGPKKRTVRVTTHRLSKANPRKHYGRENAGTGKKWTTRRKVERHWRYQAWGEQWSKRRWIFIEEYIAGPEDAPMAEKKPHVKVWRQ